ncbi:MAG: WHG domain-containing protein [Frankiaceae bacterium]|nr:WHG domain-containing protein [Frankiaceae bacterium]
MTAVQTARQRARRELEHVIKATAGRHLAESGAAALSLRAVAREMGMASSALYRYYPSRDALLTALIVDAYDAIGETAEEAADPALAAGARWLAVCRSVRGWALVHPHEWALVYGSPVPGYAAPADTVEPATRLSRVMAAVVLGAAEDGTLGVPARPLPGPRLVTDVVLEMAGGPPAPPYDDVLERSVVLLVALVGAVSYELFGHSYSAFTDDAAWFDVAMAVAAEGVGLDLPLG